MRLVVKSDKGIAAMRSLLKDSPSVMSDMTEAMADEAVDLVAQCFAEQRNPYREPWPEKKVDDGRAILVLRGRLRRSFKKTRLGPTSFMVSSSVEYAGAHQDPQPRANWGGKRLPRRAFFPFSPRGLPKEWDKAFRDAIDASLRAHFSLGTFGGGGMSALAARVAGVKRSLSIRAIVERAVRSASE